MRYTFLLYSDASMGAHMTEQDWDESKKAFGAYIGALQQAGVLIDTDWLHPADTATTITLAGGEKRVQDGPFAETKETLGGFFAVNVKNLDEALEWAEKCPAVHYGKVEIRASAMVCWFPCRNRMSGFGMRV